MRSGASPWRVAPALLTVYVVWGSVFVAVKVVVESAPPLLSIGVRYLVGAAVLAVIGTARQGLRSLALTRQTALSCVLLGLLLPVLSNGIVTVAESRGVNAGPAALLNAISPIGIVVLRALTGDRPRARSVVGVAVGFAGLALLLLRGHASDGFPLVGSIAVVGSGIFWAIGSFVQPRLVLPTSTFTVAAYEMLVGGLVLTSIGLLGGEQPSLDYPAKTWIVLGYLTLGSCVTFTCYVWLLANAPITLVSTHSFMNPVVAVFLGWLLLSEPLTPTVLIGGLTTVLAVTLVITAESGRRRYLEPGPPDV